MANHAADPHTSHTGLTEWGPGKTPRGRARLPISRRREKTQLSCDLCKQRKLKCDRQQPCSNCTKRERGPSCSYPAGATCGIARSPPPPATVQDRIHHLEDLVVHLMQGNHGSPDEPPARSSHAPDMVLQPADTVRSALTPSDHCTPEENTSPLASDSVSIDITRTGSSYVTDAHWAAVLDDIAEIKSHLEFEEHSGEHYLPDSAQSGWSGPLLLYGYSKLITREEILACMPPRSTVDLLVSSYFSSFEMSPAVLHSVEFLEEYEHFWNDQSATPIAWIGLLFAIMCLAIQFRNYTMDPSVQIAAVVSDQQQVQSTVEVFRQACVQCLLSADYVNGGLHVLETLMLYFTIEHFLSNDAEPGTWILLGTIIQIAMRMGYHRDPLQYQGMSLFCGEMRRRMWATIVALDLTISAQMGLPRLIKQWQADTAEPSNLEDRDFNKNTTLMPHSRSETDPTPMLFRIVNARMLSAMGSVWDFATDTRTYTFENVMSMDAKLKAAHASIPQCLRWSFLGLADSSQVFMQKMSLERVYHRAKIVLHRRYIRTSLRTQTSASWQICLESALKLLDYQHTLQEKTELFGQLYQDRWKISSLVKHDFLLASSILCSYLQQIDHSTVDQNMDITIRSALRRSYAIWLRTSGESKEARKAASALRVVLGIADSTRANEFSTAFETPSAVPMTLELTEFNNPQEYQSAFNLPFPGSDSTTWTDWSGPLAIDTSYSGHPSNLGVQAPELTDTMGTFHWEL